MATVVACGEGPSGPDRPDPDPPLPEPTWEAVLPGPQTMEMDVGLFTTAALPDDEPGSNWYYSAGRIANTRDHTVTISHMPRAVLAAVAGRTPQYLDDHWSWSVSAAYEGGSLSGTVTATVAADSVEWAARVSAPAHGLQNALLFEGRSDTTGVGGWWTVYHVQWDASKVLGRYRWAQAGPEQIDIEMTDPGSLHPPDSARAEFAVAGSERQLLFQHFMQSGTAAFHARWNASDRSGSLSTPVYNAGQAVCWGLKLEDVECPAPSSGG